MDNPRVRATHQHLYAAANGHSHPYPTHSHSHSYGSAPQTTRNLSASVPQQSPLQSPSQSQSHSQIIRRSHAPAPLQIPNQNYRSSPSHSPLMSPLMSPNSQILHRQASFTRKAGAGAGAGSGAGARFSPQQITDASATLFFQTANVPAAVNRHSPATSMRGSTISNGSSGRNGYGNGTSAPVSPQIPQTSPYGLRKHEEENEVEDEFDDDGNPIKREPELNEDDYDPHQPYPPEKDDDYDQHGGYYDHAGYYHIDGGFYDDYACYHVYGDYDGYYDSDGFYRTYNEDDAAAAEQAAAEEKYRMQQELLQRERERLYYEQQQRRVMQGETMLNTSRANCSLIQLFTEMTTSSSNETSKTGKQTRKIPSSDADYRNDYKHQPAEETALYPRPHDPSPRVAGRICCGPRNTPAPSSSPNPYISPHQHNPTRSVGTTYTRTSSDSASLSVPTRRISRMCTPEPVSSNREGFGRGFDLPVSPSPVKQNQRSRKHILQ